MLNPAKENPIVQVVVIFVGVLMKNAWNITGKKLAPTRAGAVVEVKLNVTLASMAISEKVEPMVNMEESSAMFTAEYPSVCLPKTAYINVNAGKWFKKKNLGPLKKPVG